MSSVPNKIQQAKQFLQKDIWEMRQNDLSRVHVFLFDTLKVAIILTKSFIKDRCSLHAAALTNITIMGILPMLAVVFALAKGFGAYEKLKAIALSKPPSPGSLIKQVQVMFLVDDRFLDLDRVFSSNTQY